MTKRFMICILVDGIRSPWVPIDAESRVLGAEIYCKDMKLAQNSTVCCEVAELGNPAISHFEFKVVFVLTKTSVWDTSKQVLDD